MCQSIKDLEFVETIRVERGLVYNLTRHNKRMNRTRRNFWGVDVEDLQLENYVHPQDDDRLLRCRVVYGKNVVRVEYFLYQMRMVRSLKLVTCNEADYSYKSTDRSLLNALFEQRGEADDVLIVREGLLTDTSIANIALYDGSDWYTPAHPLLKGTHRQLLLDEGLIHERDIRESEIGHYQEIALFNAMIPWGALQFETRFIL